MMDLADKGVAFGLRSPSGRGLADDCPLTCRGFVNVAECHEWLRAALDVKEVL